MRKTTVGILSTIIGATVGATFIKTKIGDESEKSEKKANKFKGYYNMLNQWLRLKQEGIDLRDYFASNGYKTIAIYGMGEMGNRLYNELKGTDIEVKYAIDKNQYGLYIDLEILNIDDELPTVDIIVVTATFAFDEIRESLYEKGIENVISLDDVVYGV